MMKRKRLIASCISVFLILTLFVPTLATSASSKLAAKAGPLTYQSVQLTWNAIANATHYEILRSTLPKAGFEKIDAVEETEFVDGEGLKQDTNYYYVVRAIIDESAQVESAVVKVRTLKKLIAPTGIKASVKSKALTITWKASAAATGYKISRSSQLSSGYTDIAKIGKTTKYTVKNLSTDSRYYYRISALTKYDSASADFVIRASGNAAEKAVVIPVAEKTVGEEIQLVPVDKNGTPIEEPAVEAASAPSNQSSKSMFSSADFIKINGYTMPSNSIPMPDMITNTFGLPYKVDVDNLFMYYDFGDTYFGPDYFSLTINKNGKVQGPRGTKIGDSVEQVKSSFFYGKEEYSYTISGLKKYFIYLDSTKYAFVTRDKSNKIVGLSYYEDLNDWYTIIVTYTFANGKVSEITYDIMLL